MKLDEKTTLPLWAMIGSIPMVVGLVSWITFVAYTSQTTASQLSEFKIEQKEKQKEFQVDLKSIDSTNREILNRLIRIESRIEKRDR